MPGKIVRWAADSFTETLGSPSRDPAAQYNHWRKPVKRKNETFKAKEQLGRAIDIYKECGADGWVKRAEEELVRLA